MGRVSTQQTYFSLNSWYISPAAAYMHLRTQTRTQTHTHTHTHTDILTFYILHNHAEVPTGFKGAEHGDDKWILREGEDVSLHKGLLDLVPQDQVLLINLLHGKPLASLQMTHQVHSTGTNTDLSPGG